jgi:ABC-type protease/lipase transport system fused ATPase/permease subunit
VAILVAKKEDKTLRAIKKNVTAIFLKSVVDSSFLFSSIFLKLVVDSSFLFSFIPISSISLLIHPHLLNQPATEMQFKKANGREKREKRRIEMMRVDD